MAAFFVVNYVNLEKAFFMGDVGFFYSFVPKYIR